MDISSNIYILRNALRLTNGSLDPRRYTDLQDLVKSVVNVGIEDGSIELKGGPGTSGSGGENPSMGYFWRLLGNDNTSIPGAFLGTTSNDPLRFKVFNTHAGFISNVKLNTSLGLRTLPLGVIGNQNVAIGNSSMAQATLASDCTVVGAFSGFNLTAGSRNTSIGFKALYSNTLGSNNTIVGESALKTASLPLNVTAIGYRSQELATSSDNTSLGTNSLRRTTGTHNTAIGMSSMLDKTEGDNNTAIGHGSLSGEDGGEYNTGEGNTAVGSMALNKNTTGDWNVGIGVNALSSNTTGDQNVAIGSGSLNLIVTGADNVSVGINSLANIGGVSSDNTAIGTNAGFDSDAGLLIAASKSVFIGANATARTTSSTNEIVIGTDAIGNGSNSVVIGNDDITKTELKGNVSIGGATPSSYAGIDIQTPNRGFKLPGVTGTYLLSLSLDPDDAGLVYFVDTGNAPTFPSVGWYGWDGSSWIQLG